MNETPWWEICDLPPPVPPKPKIKEHEIAKIVNDLNAIARKWGHTQQLRAHISQYIVPILVESSRISSWEKLGR
jgi:hypothetical protein